MIRLSSTQINAKLGFIDKYIKASNAADGSKMDANANVSHKNVATLFAEINKDINIQLKRALISKKLDTIYPKSGINSQYLDQLEKHEIYAHDETAFCLPYCAAVSLYPFLEQGLKPFGGESAAPKHLSSFCGGYINLIFALSSQFAGAIATPELLICFDYFAKRDYGPDYLWNETSRKIVFQELQQVVYAINQPASARGSQSCFINWSIFDEHYFKSLFSNFIFPDGHTLYWESVSELQEEFLVWFNQERTKAILTFPVVTICLLNDKATAIDTHWKDITTREVSKGNAFFIYTSNTVDSLSSCCRLRSAIDVNDFSYSLGAGGIQTGSINVITLNMNRFVQNIIYDREYEPDLDLPIILESLSQQIKLMHKYQIGVKEYFKDLQRDKMLPAYDAHFIDLDKQYLTIGINGLLESAEYLGYTPTNNVQYKHYVKSILRCISDVNKETCSKIPSLKLNTEIVPAEGVGVKFAHWDTKDGYVVSRDCYNSYLYRVEDEEISIVDKIILHGIDTTQYLDGGSALHINLENYPTKKTAERLLDIIIREGCPYFCFNVKVTVCNICGYINKKTSDHCTECHSTDVDYATRIIGYLKRITSFSTERQLEEKQRAYTSLSVKPEVML